MLEKDVDTEGVCVPKSDFAVVGIVDGTREAVRGDRCADETGTNECLYGIGHILIGQCLRNVLVRGS